jgi:hypothetical protein
MYLYRVHTKSTRAEADEDWLKEFRSKCVCPGLGCKEIFHKVREKGIDVYLNDRPAVSAINVVNPGISISRRDFMELFQEEVEKYLITGNVYLKGKILESHVTFVGPKRLPLRGNIDGTRDFGKCKICGQYRYWPAHPWHILRSSLFDQPLYESYGLGGLVINDQLRARIERGRWKGIYITKLPVLDEPQDGIDNFPVDINAIV